MSAYGDWMSPNVRFILLNSRQDPIKLSRDYLAAAECTNAADVHFEGSATIRAVEIGPRCRRLRVPVANKRPVLTP